MSSEKTAFSVAPTIFDGDSAKFNLWKIGATNNLIAHSDNIVEEIYEPITEEVDVENPAITYRDPAYESSAEKRARVIAYLTKSIKESVLTLIYSNGKFNAREIDSPLRLWKALEKQYSNVTPARLRTLELSFYNVKLNPDTDKTFSHYSSRVQGIATQLRAAGRAVSESEEKRALMNGLPRSFKETCDSIESRGADLPPMLDLISTLAAQFDREKDMDKRGNNAEEAKSLHVSNGTERTYKKNFKHQSKKRKNENETQNTGTKSNSKKKRRFNYSDRPDGDFRDQFCKWCGHQGHNPSNCQKNPVCEICNKKGHTSETCWNNKNK